MTTYTFIHLPPRRKEKRSEYDIQFEHLLWIAKFKKGKYRFSRQDIKERWGIDLYDLSKASKLFLASIPTWYVHLCPILEENALSYELVDLINSNVCFGKDNQNEFNLRIPISDYYLLSPVNNNTPIAFEVIEFLKKNRPHSKIIVGGAQATFEDLEFLLKGVDIVVRGEGELTFEQIVQGLPLDSIRGISFMKNGKYTKNMNRELIKNLDRLPFYKWENQPSEYNHSFYRRFFAQRGCPMNCCFCSDVLEANQKVRRKSISRIEKEIDSIVRNTEFLEMHIGDNCLTSSRKFAIEFAELLSDYNFNWTGETRVDMVDQELLNHLSKCGCVELEFGAESASDKVLKLSDKKQDRNRIVKAFEMTKNAGIHVHTNWMVGLPGETRESFIESVNFVCEMTKNGLIDTMNHVILVPYPGTPIATYPQQYGIKILTKNWIEYDEYGLPVFESKTISRQDIYDLWEYGNRKFAEVLSITHNSMLV